MKRLSKWIAVFLLLYTFADISFLLSYEKTESFDNQSYCRLDSQHPTSFKKRQEANRISSVDSKYCSCPTPQPKPTVGNDDCLSCSLFLSADNHIIYPAQAVAFKSDSTFLGKFLQPDSTPNSFFRPPRRV